jgi:hypothetical protein
LWDNGYDLEDVDTAARSKVFATGYGCAGDNELRACVRVFRGFEIEGADTKGEFVGLEGVAGGFSYVDKGLGKGNWRLTCPQLTS